MRRSNQPSTKIQIAFAAERSEAVIFRQGPSRWTRMLSWCTRTDQIRPGQWIKGKIRHLAVNSNASLVLVNIQRYGTRHDGQPASPWIALSRPPWFSALAVWHVGDSRGGRCAFISDRQIFIGSGIQPVSFKGALQQDMEWTSDRRYQSVEYEQSRQGWKPLGPPSNMLLANPGVKHSSLLPLEACREGSRVTLYFAQDNVREQLEQFEDVFSSNFDSQGQFIFTRCNGVIYRASFDGRKISIATVCDLSTMKPEEIVCPPDVTNW